MNLQTDSIYRLFMTLLFECKLQNPNHMFGQSERRKKKQREAINIFNKANCSTKNYTIHQNIQNQKRKKRPKSFTFNGIYFRNKQQIFVVQSIQHAPN